MRWRTVGATVPTLKANLAPEQRGREKDRFTMKTIESAGRFRKVPTIGKKMTTEDEERRQTHQEASSQFPLLRCCDGKYVGWQIWKFGRLRSRSSFELKTFRWCKDLDAHWKHTKQLPQSMFLFSKRDKVVWVVFLQPSPAEKPHWVQLCSVLSLSLWTRAN